MLGECPYRLVLDLWSSKVYGEARGWASVLGSAVSSLEMCWPSVLEVWKVGGGAGFWTYI